MLFKPTGNSQGQFLRFRGIGGVSGVWWDDGGLDWDGLFLSDGTASIASIPCAAHGWSDPFVLEVVGTTHKVTHSGVVAATATSTRNNVSGLWQYDNTHVELISFEVLDTKPPRTATPAATVATSPTLAPAHRLGGLTRVSVADGSSSTVTVEARRIGGVQRFSLLARATGSVAVETQRMGARRASASERAVSAATASARTIGGVRRARPEPTVATHVLTLVWHAVEAAIGRKKSRGLYSDTVTLWRDLGEVDYQRRWQREVVTGVRLEERSGAVASLRGMQSVDGATLYIDGRVGFEPPVDGDLLALGTLTAAEPPADALKVISIEEHRLRGRVHHWEVAAK